MRKTLLQTLCAAFCAILFHLSALGGGGINLGARIVAWHGGMPTALDYVQDSLVAMWYGIENAGWGVHDYDDSYWVNLTTGIRCSCQGVVKYRNYASFGADGVESILRSGFDIKNYGTIEFLISKQNLGKDVNKCSIVGGPSRYDGWWDLRQQWCNRRYQRR